MRHTDVERDDDFERGEWSMRHADVEREWSMRHAGVERGEW